MEYTIQQSDIAILRTAGMNAEDITHSVHVAVKALEIAQRIKGVAIDRELVGRGALFHDLGKTKTHEMEHGRIGAELGCAIGLPRGICDIMEKHIRGGLTGPEAEELGLPIRDYTLRKLEERIVIYADRLVDIIHDGIVPVKSEREAEDRFEEILQTYPKYGKNQITLERYLGYHREIQGLMQQLSKRTITPGELKVLASPVAVIDVRRKADYDGKTILNAEWRDPEAVDQWAKDLPKGKEIVLYCARGGSVSNGVLDKLLSANITARYIEGGIEAWKKSGGKVGEKESQS
jgi:uncharacterized protein